MILDATYEEPSIRARVVDCTACGEVTLYLDGDLDLATAPQLESTLARLELPRQHTLVIDLSDVGFMDSHGVQVLVEAHALAARVGCSLLVRSPQPIVARVLEITGLDQFLAVSRSG
jgi:anti-anti-sigma factor